MHANDVSQEDLAQKLGVSTGYISQRIRGIYPWNFDDVYKICGLLDICPSDISIYFPPRN